MVPECGDSKGRDRRSSKRFGPKKRVRECTVVTGRHVTGRPSAIFPAWSSNAVASFPWRGRNVLGTTLAGVAPWFGGDDPRRVLHCHRPWRTAAHRRRATGRPTGPLFPTTLLADVTNDALVMREESFGPLLPVSAVGDDEEALQRMNHSRYGLTASGWTRHPTPEPRPRWPGTYEMNI